MHGFFLLCFFRFAQLKSYIEMLSPYQPQFRCAPILGYSGYLIQNKTKSFTQHIYDLSPTAPNIKRNNLMDGQPPRLLCLVPPLLGDLGIAYDLYSAEPLQKKTLQNLHLWCKL